MTRIAAYARVSTGDQDAQRQLDELHEYVNEEYPHADEIDTYTDIISGTDTAEAQEYDRLWTDIDLNSIDVVVVHEISRLSRLGGAEIYKFIQHALEHDTGIESLDVGLSIRVDDPALQQTIYTMIANIMGDLAKIEHQQKMDRIRSGIRAAQNAGKWTARPPRGFYVGDDDKRLHVDTTAFLETREALERIEHDESFTAVAEATGIPNSTLRYIANDDERRALYFYGEADDDRVTAALDELGDLPEPDLPDDDFEAQVRAIVRDELTADQ